MRERMREGQREVLLAEWIFRIFLYSVLGVLNVLAHLMP
jgi:hypothetical protein